jgi:hypothetical protein
MRGLRRIFDQEVLGHEILFDLIIELDAARTAAGKTPRATKPQATVGAIA